MAGSGNLVKKRALGKEPVVLLVSFSSENELRILPQEEDTLPDAPRMQHPYAIDERPYLVGMFFAFRAPGVSCAPQSTKWLHRRGA